MDVSSQLETTAVNLSETSTRNGDYENGKRHALEREKGGISSLGDGS